MSEDLYRGSLTAEGKPSRIEILRGSGGKNPYFKKGQFAYVVGVNTAGGSYFADRGEDTKPTEPGEVAFLVSKTPGMGGGALWLSADAIRFTKPPKEALNTLSGEERVALDLFLGGSSQTTVAELVPDAERRGYVKMIATQIKSLRRW